MQKIDELTFIGTEDVAKILGCSIVTAREIMRRKDFPLVKVGKNYKVAKLALIEWASTRRV